MKEETKSKLKAAAEWLWAAWLDHPGARGFVIGLLVGWLFL